MRLTEHFTLEELTATSVRGVDNDPSPEVETRLLNLAENVLEPIRRQFGPVVIHSGYRSPEVNQRVGGSRSSQHCTGNAADFHVVGVDFFTVARWIVANLDFDQLILEFCHPSGFGKGWIHCSFVTDRENRRRITVASSVKGITTYRDIKASQIPVAA